MELLTMVGTYGGFTTVITAVCAWLYRKQNKRLKEAEAALAEANVAKAKIEGKADEFHLIKEQCEMLATLNADLTSRNKELVAINAEKEDRHQQDIKDWEERFDKQTDRLRGVQRDLIAANDREKEHIRREARLEKERDHFKMWRCYRENDSLDPDEGCGRRKPQQPVIVKYVPLEGECEDDCSECSKICRETTINLNKD